MEHHHHAGSKQTGLDNGGGAERPDRGLQIGERDPQQRPAGKRDGFRDDGELRLDVFLKPEIDHLEGLRQKPERQNNDQMRRGAGGAKRERGGRDHADGGDTSKQLQKKRGAEDVISPIGLADQFANDDAVDAEICHGRENQGHRDGEVEHAEAGGVEVTADVTEGDQAERHAEHSLANQPGKVGAKPVDRSRPHRAYIYWLGRRFQFFRPLTLFEFAVSLFALGEDGSVLIPPSSCLPFALPNG
jgi:hypothetical protein